MTYALRYICPKPGDEGRRAAIHLVLWAMPGDAGEVGQIQIQIHKYTNTKIKPGDEGRRAAIHLVLGTVPGDAGEVGHIGVHQEHVASLNYHTKAPTTVQNHLGKFRGAQRNAIETVIEMQIKSHKNANAIEIVIEIQQKSC